MNLKYYSEPISCIYPTSFFFTCNQKYIRNVAKLIIETGQTVKAILEDLKSLCACIEHVDMLCVSNYGYRLEGLTHLQPILEKFNYIGCNK